MRTFNKILSFIGGSVRRLIMLALVALFFGGQFLGWWEMPSLVNVNVTPPAQTHQSDGVNVATEVWSRGEQNNSDANATSHFKKHGREFPYKTKDAYIAAAMEFVMNPPTGTLTVIQSDGDKVFYHPAKNYFAVTSRQGRIRTFFRLDPHIHGYPTNMAYFEAQGRR